MAECQHSAASYSLLLFIIFIIIIHGNPRGSDSQPAESAEVSVEAKQYRTAGNRVGSARTTRAALWFVKQRAFTANRSDLTCIFRPTPSPIGDQRAAPPQCSRQSGCGRKSFLPLRAQRTVLNSVSPKPLQIAVVVLSAMSCMGRPNPCAADQIVQSQRFSHLAARGA
jgi:hypothetical protein